MRLEKRTMNIATYRKCFDICDKIREARKGKKENNRDYRHVIVSCADSWLNYSNTFIGESGKVDSSTYNQAPTLRSALETLGKIGMKRNGCKNYIGACAEPHAAKSVIEKYPTVAVNELVFSYAYRIRTKNVIRYCRNCTDIFNVQNP